MTENETKTYAVEHGAMTEAPAYEHHKRGKNWLATISPNPSAPGGLDREFVERGRGKYYYVVADLAPGTPIEFGADYYSAGGKRHPSRWYGVVVRVAADVIEIAPAEDADEAFALAEEIIADARREQIVLAGNVAQHLEEMREELREAAPPSSDRYEIEGYETLEKRATAYGTGAHVCVPRGWIGSRVKIVRRDP